MSLCDRLRTLHQYCQTHPQQSLIYGHEIGVLLEKSRQRLENESEWEQWLRQDCGLSVAAVEVYRAIARTWPSCRHPPSSPPLPLSDSYPTQPVSASGHKDVKRSLTTLQAAIAPTPELDRPLLRFILPGGVVPKARPRVTHRGTYLPERYREWRQEAEGELIVQLAQQNEGLDLPLKQARVEIELRGKQRMNADGDNIMGSCLDALVAVGVFKNDSLSYIPELGFKYVPKGSQEVEIRIRAIAV